jgi:hypothetical protein
MEVDELCSAVDVSCSSRGAMLGSRLTGCFPEPCLGVMTVATKTHERFQKRKTDGKPIDMGEIFSQRRPISRDNVVPELRGSKIEDP